MRTAWLMGCLSLTACAGARSGHASAEWISVSTTCEPGVALQTAIRLVVDAGWHTYWLNPGEGGMNTSVEWELPAGWSASTLAHPVPTRFRTAGLAGFGYVGTVIFPATITPPPNFKGRATLKARLSWLTCDENRCVPGDAELSLVLDAGPPTSTADAEVIRDALKKIPRPQDESLRLSVTEKPGFLLLAIDARPDGRFDPSRCEVFPATPQAIDPAADIRFARNDAGWIAEVPKSEYAAGPLKQLTLVFSGKGADEPVELTWKAR